MTEQLLELGDWVQAEGVTAAFAAATTGLAMRKLQTLFPAGSPEGWRSFHEHQIEATMARVREAVGKAAGLSSLLLRPPAR